MLFFFQFTKYLNFTFNSFSEEARQLLGMSTRGRSCYKDASVRVARKAPPTVNRQRSQPLVDILSS